MTEVFMGNDGKKTIQIPYSLTVRELALLVNVSPIQIIKVLMANGVMASINQQIDFDTAAVAVTELGFEPELEHMEEEIKEEGEVPLWRRLRTGHQL
jgi:translation initiation factor IF-2